jgi:hypothetical protein
LGSFVGIRSHEENKGISSAKKFMGRRLGILPPGGDKKNPDECTLKKAIKDAN